MAAEGPQMTAASCAAVKKPARKTLWLSTTHLFRIGPARRVVTVEIRVVAISGAAYMYGTGRWVVN